jgi:hypothetical protein
MFGTDYLELIAVPAGTTARPDILNAPEGLNGLMFGTEDAAATYAALHEAGVPVQPPNDFSRPVALTDGPRNAVFRTVRLTDGTVASGRIQFCQHFTRDVVWRDEWRHHANGVIGVARAVIAARATVNGTPTDAESSVEVKLPGSKVLLTTDTPIYQPGQTVRVVLNRNGRIIETDVRLAKR